MCAKAVTGDLAPQRNWLKHRAQDQCGSREAERCFHVPAPDLVARGPIAALVDYTMIYFSGDSEYVKRIKRYCPPLATAIKVIVLVNISFRK